MSNISKLIHEKLLAAIESARSDAQLARDALTFQKKCADGFERQLAEMKDLSSLHDESLKRERELHRMVSDRDQALVHLSLRLSLHGDPEPIAGTE